MLRSANDLRGKRVRATDGELGDVRDCYFDDRDWTVLYFVVDTADWLPGRSTLVSPIALGGADWAEGTLSVMLSKADVEGGPALDLRRPVTREEEVAHFGHFGWPCLWEGQLRNLQELIGCRVEAEGAEAGRVTDLLVNEQTWRIQYLVVESETHASSGRFLVAPQAVEGVDWPGRAVRLNVTREKIESAPAYDPSAPLDREYETALHEHHGWTPYWG